MLRYKSGNCRGVTIIFISRRCSATLAVPPSVQSWRACRFESALETHATAEVWNKLATAQYLAGDLDASEASVAEVRGGEH